MGAAASVAPLGIREVTIALTAARLQCDVLASEGKKRISSYDCLCREAAYLRAYLSARNLPT